MRTLRSFFAGLAAFLAIALVSAWAQRADSATQETGANGSVNPAAKTAPADPNSLLGPNTPAGGHAVPDNTAPVSGANDMRRAALSAKDLRFVHAASQGGLFEIETGRYAGRNAAAYNIRSLGRQIAKDHVRLSGQLGEIAASKGIRVPDRLDAAHRAMADRLEALPKDGFDSAYLAALAKAHRKDIAAFEKEAAGGDDADLRAFAEQALPTLREHLHMLHEQRRLE